MTKFRPCIDIHDGVVKQIVGGTLTDSDNSARTNFVADKPPAYFANMYKRDNLRGGHVIKLGPGNDHAAKEALAAWPGGMQLGGGITPDNAASWLDAGADKLIVTSWLFDDDVLNMDKVSQLSKQIGKKHLVIDLSCRRTQQGWMVATNRWQTITETAVDAQTIELLATHCAEFLVHAADVEGQCQGIDLELVRHLGAICPIPCTYAGGANDIIDLQTVSDNSNNAVDLTFGSALDIFGGTGVTYTECVVWNKTH